jgi:1,4-dihydroxy-2-naphthoate octaprenyltransferase
MNGRIIRAWVEAMRLRTLPVSVAGVVCGFAYAIADGYGISWAGWVCLLFALLCQTASNFANEYFDWRAGRDAPGREGPRRGVTEGDISPRAMAVATAVTVGVACILGLTLVARGGWWMIAVGAAVVAGVYAYSAGPWPLSTHGLGEAAVVVFFGLVPVSLTYYLLTLTMTAEVLAASAGIGLLGANVLVVNNYRDIPDDRAVGKRTLAVRFGGRAMMRLYRVNAVLAAAALAPGYAHAPGFIVASGLIAAFGFRAAAAMSRESGRRLNPWLGRTAVFMAAASALLLVAALV